MIIIKPVVKQNQTAKSAHSAWISYSDMMAALLLVFVLVLCYTIYQYFSLLETKTAELDAQAALLNSQKAQLLDQQNDLDSALSEIDIQKGLVNLDKAPFLHGGNSYRVGTEAGHLGQPLLGETGHLSALLLPGDAGETHQGHLTPQQVHRG